MEGCVLFKAVHSLRINHFVVVAVSVKLSCVRNIYFIMIFSSRSVDSGTSENAPVTNANYRANINDYSF